RLSWNQLTVGQDWQPSHQRPKIDKDMHTLIQDLRFGLRVLAKHAGVTVVAVITFVLCFGGQTANFSLVNAVILRPLPYKNPDALVSLWENVPERGRWRVTPGNFFDWKKQNTTFEEMAAFGANSMTLTGGGEPEQLLGTRAAAGFFSVIGV